MELMFRVRKDGEIETICARCGASTGTTAPLRTNLGTEGSRRYRTPTGGIFVPEEVDHPAQACVGRQQSARAAAEMKPAMPGEEQHTVWPLG